MRIEMRLLTALVAVILAAGVGQAAVVTADGDRLAIGMESDEAYRKAKEAERYERDATDWLGSLGTETVVAPASSMVSLNLRPTVPDVQAGLLQINYTVSGSTGLLTVSGTPLNFKENNTDPTTPIGSPKGYDLSVEFDTATGEPISGSLAISGDLGGGSQSLLEGSVAEASVMDHSVVDGDVLFEFKFDVTGGLLGPLYGSTAGIVLAASGNSGLPAFDFGADWRSSGINVFSNTANTTALVPEPSVMLTSLIGLTVLAARRRRSAGESSRGNRRKHSSDWPPGWDGHGPPRKGGKRGRPVMHC